MAIARWSPPRRGILQGLEPADPAFDPLAAPALQNIRVVRGLWATRRGQAAWLILPGTGRTRLLTTLYWRSQRIRLGARGQNGAVGLYDLLEQTDSAFQQVLDSDGNPVNDFAGNPIHYLTQYEREYLTDQETILRRYSPEDRTCDPVVNLPTPAEAPQIVKSFYGFVEPWLPVGDEPWDWYESDDTELSLEDVESTNPDFNTDIGGTARLRSVAGAKGEFVRKNEQSMAGKPVPLEMPIPTADICCWIYQTIARTIFEFRIGQQQKRDLAYDVNPPVKEVPYVFFMNVLGITTLNYLQINNILPQTINRNLIMSALQMPGYLLGPYQWRYTYYRESTGEESSPSDAGPDAPMLFTQGVSYVNTTWDAATRCAVVIVVPNPAAEAGDKIRVYRSGGTPSLTATAIGEPVWLLSGTIDNFETTLTSAASEDDTTLDVADATGFEPVTENGVTTYQWFAIGVGTTEQETGKVLSVAGNVLTLELPLQYDHADDSEILLAYLDNVPNEVIASEPTQLDLERDTAPQGIKWLARTGDGRMWAANFLEDRDGDDVHEYRRPMGVAVSNKPTPLRRRDHEIFPIAVDPYTTNSPTQGFRFDLAADAGGDEIMWFGIFQGLPTFLTRQAVYRVTSFAQTDWGAGSVRKVLDRGCICGDAVQEINRLLIWPSDGPSVLAWDGRGGPRDISDYRVSGEGDTYLGNAPAGYVSDEDVLTTDNPTYYWESWFAEAHAVGSLIYYRLWMIPEDPLLARITDLTLLSATTVSSAQWPFTSEDVGRGIEIPEMPPQLGWYPGLYRIESVDGYGVATLNEAIGAYGYGYPYSTGNAVLWGPFNTLRLDYDVLHDTWEPVRYGWDRDGTGKPTAWLGWDTGDVQYGAGDDRGLFAAAWNPDSGDLWEQEMDGALLDGEVPIQIQASTPRVSQTNGWVGTLNEMLMRLYREAGACDEMHVTITLGGSEHGQQSQCQTIRLEAGQHDGDTELMIPFELKDRPQGRWAQLSFLCDATSGPKIREFTDNPQPVREGRMSP